MPKMLRDRAFDFLCQPSARNSDWASWNHKPSEVIKVKIVGPVVIEGIDTNDGVKEIRRERQRPGVGVQGGTRRPLHQHL